MGWKIYVWNTNRYKWLITDYDDEFFQIIVELRVEVLYITSNFLLPSLMVCYNTQCSRYPSFHLVGKLLLFPGNLRIPLIASWPRWWRKRIKRFYKIAFWFATMNWIQKLYFHYAWLTCELGSYFMILADCKRRYINMI